MTSFLNSITKRKKTPEQLVVSASQSLISICDPEVSIEVKTSVDEILRKRLGQMKMILYGDGKVTEVDENKASELSRHIITVIVQKLKISNCGNNPY